MMTQQDLAQISARGISEAQIERQLKQIENGFPFLKLEGAAAIGKGIMSPTEEEKNQYVKAWEEYKKEGHTVVKFVPASGAASRMFKNMFAFLDAPYDVPTTDFEKNSSPTSRSSLSARLSAKNARKTKAKTLSSCLKRATTRP